jgi:membrane protein DedA with SNARE-associated domain
MLAVDLAQFVDQYFARFHYLAPFVVLLLCGVGLPLPEEVTLLGCGGLLYEGHVSFVAISLVCGLAILIGDSVPYWLGRHWGMRALEKRWVRRVLHPELFARFEARFQRHGNWAIFACRFLAGLRIPGYFIAGTMGMSYVRFLVLDALGVLISVPTSIWLGKLFFGKIDELQRYNKNLHHWLGYLAAALVLVIVVRWFLRRSSGAPPRPPDDEPRAAG